MDQDVKEQANPTKPKKKQVYSEARKNGNRKWDAANLDRMSVALPKGMKEKITEYSRDHGFKSVNDFIGESIQMAMSKGMSKTENGNVLFPQNHVSTL